MKTLIISGLALIVAMSVIAISKIEVGYILPIGAIATGVFALVAGIGVYRDIKTWKEDSHA